MKHTSRNGSGGCGKQAKKAKIEKGKKDRCCRKKNNINTKLRKISQKVTSKEKEMEMVVVLTNYFTK